MNNMINTPIGESGVTPMELFTAALESAEAPEAAPVEAPVEVAAPEPVAAPSAAPEAVPVAAPAAFPAPVQTVTQHEGEHIIDPETVANAVTAMESNITPPAQAGVVEEAELPDFNSEEFMDEFYDNPAGAVQKAANLIADKKIKEVVSGIEGRIKPLLDQSAMAQRQNDVKRTIGDFLTNNEDAKDYFSDMVKYMKSNNLDPTNNQSYLDAYRVSKLGRQDNRIRELEANQGRGLNDYLSDEASLNQILNNENVKSKVIENYLRGLSNGGKPATIGNNSGATPSATSPNRATTMNEAKQMLINKLSQ